MCGIAGVYSHDRKVEAAWVRAMTGAMRHRGPDDEGYLAVEGAGERLYSLSGPDSRARSAPVEAFSGNARLVLGHRRLSILDLSDSGAQPMGSPDGSVWAVYNGEIYNYRELRVELESKGYNFRTNTDTEVLIAAYSEWGGQCLFKFNGMWAFVIYDRVRDVLFGARDRFGVKPFYYYTGKGRFAFASEIKALLKLPFVEKRINGPAAFDYLASGLEESTDETLFKGIFELPPSFAFTHDLSENGFKKWRYYDLKTFDGWAPFDPKRSAEYALLAKDLIFSSVRSRLISDVPVGTCLSGGIDSSAIVCVINSLLEKERLEQVGERQKVFTASYDGNAVDEGVWAGEVVRSTRTEWRRTFPKADELIRDLEDLVYAQDLPFGSTSIYAQYRVMRLAAENGVKVLLDGQGGDELFSGYASLYAPFFAEMIKRRRLSLLAGELKGLSNSPVSKKALSGEMLKLLAARTLPPSLLTAAYGLRAKEMGYIRREFWEANKERLLTIAERKLASLNSALKGSMCRGLKSLLRYEDRNSMRFSIEARTPFADDVRLIEAVFMMPPVYKIHGGWSKFLLREAMRGVVPDKILSRRDKVGFATPEADWLVSSKGALRGYIENDSGEFFDKKRLIRDGDLLLGSRSPRGCANLWRFINLSVWRKVYGL